MTIYTSNLINWNIYFKCINCDLGQKVVRGDPSANYKIGIHLEDKVLHLVAFWDVDATSGYTLRCRCCVWLCPENLIDGSLGPGCIWRCRCGIWLHPENLESRGLRPDTQEMRHCILICD